MDWQMISLLGLLPALMVGYVLGRGTVEYPSEEEMFRRLVSARAERKVRKWTVEGLEAEIEGKAATLAHNNF